MSLNSTQHADENINTAITAATLIELLRARADAHPDRRAFTFLEESDRPVAELTYGELDRQARMVAAALAAVPAYAERVLLLYPPALGYVSAFFGCLYAGAVAVPAYPPRRNRKLGRLVTLVADSKARVVLTTARILASIEPLFAEMPALRALRWIATDELADELADAWTEPDVDGDTLAFLQYTSGSTSAPKGVMVTHRNLLVNEEMIRRAFDQSESSVIVSWLPMYHDMGLIGGVLQPLYLGARCVLMSPTTFLQRPLRWLEAISHYRATTSGGPNFAYDLCARKATPEDVAALDLSHWRVAFNGSEPIRPDTLARFSDAFAACGFRREAFQPCYGLAEATLLVTATRTPVAPTVAPFDADAMAHHHVEKAKANHDSRLLVGCGTAHADEQVAIIHPEQLTACAAEEIGEVWVKGPAVARGYWGRDAETQATFHARRADNGDGPYLRTGDLGFVSGGELFITGRLKDLIIIRGRNLYPQDIELTVERGHAGLRAGCGAAFSIEVAGEERVVVVQELDHRMKGESANTDEIINAIRQAVTQEHEVQPHAIVLVKAGSVPKTSSGKIQRRACKQMFLDGALERLAGWRAHTTVSEPGRVPQPDLATAESVRAWLLAVVAEITAVPQSAIDLNEPVTTYGLDSVGAIELAHRIETGSGVAVPLSQLLHNSTITRLEELILTHRKIPTETRAIAARPERTTVARPPLSHGEKALWFLHQMNPQSAAYHIARAVRITSGLDVAALRDAFQTLVERHAALRTVFPAIKGEPTREVRDSALVAFEEFDAKGWGAPSLGERLRREAERPFDLAEGPLLRVAVFTKAAREHVLLVTTHHIISDFWSLVIMLRELGEIYTAAGRGNEPLLAPLAADYSDYVIDQTEMLGGPEGERCLAYWQGQLAGELPPSSLPTDRPRPAAQSHRGATISFEIEPQVASALYRTGQSAGATLYMTLLAAFKCLLYRYSGQEEIIIGTPTAGRLRPEYAPVIGYFVNPVVLRSRLSRAISFTALLRSVVETALAAFDHQGMPFDLLVERLQQERDPGRSPIFQVMFAFQSIYLRGDDQLSMLALGKGGGRMKVGELELETIDLDDSTSQFDLTLTMAETSKGLSGRFRYNADLFDGERIARMAAHFRNLLAAIAADPSRRLAQLDLLSEEERRRLLVEYNGTRRDYRLDLCVHQLIHQQALRTPDHLAVRFEQSQLTYQELDERANQLAHFLIEQGVCVDQLVGLCLPRSLEMMVGLLGILKAGAAFVPIDPSYPRERIGYMRADSQARLLLAVEATAHLADRDDDNDQADEARVICLDRDWPLISRCSSDDPAVPVDGQNLAYMIYTSGTTGRPKGAMVHHRGISNRLQWMAEQYEVNEQDRVLQKTPMSFDVSVWEYFLALMRGGCVVVARPGGQHDPAYLVEVMKEERVSLIHYVPAMLKVMLEEAGLEQLSELRQVISSGEELGRGEVERLQARIARAEIDNLYGPTEASVDVTWHRCERGEGRGKVPIGRAIANVQVYVLDEEMGLVAEGVEGEIYLGGEGIGRGYWQRPAETAERYVPDPYSEAGGGRLYRTGDVGRVVAGEVIYEGRRDEQVKVRGMRVELGEIARVMEEAEGVREAVVVMRKGEGTRDEQMVGYVVCEEGREVSEESLREYLRERLPEWMVPVRVVAIEEVPLTPSGKVDRKALPVPETNHPQPHTAYVPPRSSLERRISEIWKDVLQLDRVGVSDNFFDLGGHSLLMVKVHSRLQEEFNNKLSIVELFNYPTVAALASYLNDAAAHTASITSPQTARRATAQAAATASGDESSIAIIGMSGRFPGARDLAQFWENLRSGTESVSFFEDDELDYDLEDDAVRRAANFVKAGAVLEGADLFDASFFGYNPREAELMDPQQRVLLECAWAALENAGYAAEQYRGAIGVYVGATINTYLLNRFKGGLLRSAEGYQTLIASAGDFLATRISYKLNLKGPSLNVQTACSTSLVAVHLACRSLVYHDCDMALAGGVSISDPQKSGYLYQEGMILSPDGHCRAFDERAQGTVGGSGVGVVVLKRLADALRDNDRIYAVIRGTAINNDGSLKVGYTAPSIEGQAEVIQAALDAAGVEAQTISYVEAHGTGTPLGDPIEIAALTQVFRRHTGARGFCALGSVKTNVGHLDAAAGVTGLIKTALALDHKQLPPIVNFERPNPKIDFEHSPFFVNTALGDWQPDGGVRRAGVSSFGIGGTNAHAVLEEAPAPAPSGPSRLSQLLLLSAKTATALAAQAANLAAYLKQNPRTALADVAYTSQVGRTRFNHRLMLVCDSHEAAIAALEDGQVYTSYGEASAAPVVFMFPGQGAQHVNMGKRLYDSEPTFRECVDRCSETLKPPLGFDLRAVLYPNPSEEAQAAALLNQTAVTQPALFVIEYALARLWMEWGVQPQAMIGHSVGEYVAACLAGVFALEDALALIAERGRLMGELPAGAMLAVSLSAESLRPRIGNLALAAINAPSQCVVSGPREQVDALEIELQREGVICRRLQTSHAFHSEMMDGILERFSRRVADVERKPPQLPYLSNLTGTWIEPQQATDPNYWANHLRHTVRFADAIAELLSDSQRLFLEVGPGQALGSLTRQNAESVQRPVIISSMRRPTDDRSDAQCLTQALGHAWLAGARMDWEGYYRHERRRRVALPTYPFESRRYWIEHNIERNGSHRTGAAAATGTSTSLEPAAPAPASSFHPRPGLPINYTAPRTPTESAVAEVWEKIFGIEKIGIHDDFFDLGGHTLMAAQVVSRLCDAFQIELPLRCLFERPTVAGLAERIESIKGERTAATTEPIRRAPRDTDLPLSFAQQRMWFLDRLTPGSAFYNLPAAVHLEGRLDVAALVASLARIVARHDVLRTTFAEIEGRPVQTVADTGALDFRVHDLSELPDAVRAVEARRLAAEEARRPFNLTTGPLMRAALVRLAPAEHVVLLTLHHIVSDGWSVGVLIAEVTALYNAINEGRPDPLAPLEIQYADFARWQRDWLKGERLDAQLAYWRAQLGGELPLIELPGARPRPETLDFRGRREYFTAPAATVEALKDLSRREDVTFFMVLLAALQTLLHRYSGQTDIIIGSPIANRTRPETEGLIGFFVNTLALRTDLGDNPTFRALLTRVREVTLGAYAHQDLPFEHLVEALHPQRNLSYTPIFQVMFILQNAPGHALELPELNLRLLETDSGTAKFDLLVEVAESDDGLSASVEYNTDLYDTSTIQRMIAHFKTLLEEVAQDADRPLSRLRMAGDEETLGLSAEFIEDLEMEMDF